MQVASTSDPRHLRFAQHPALRRKDSGELTVPLRRKINDMVDELTADEVRTLLKLEPNATCGFVRVTFESAHSIAAGGLSAVGLRALFHGDTRRAGASSPHP
jgi:hypothetical protein